MTIAIIIPDSWEPAELVRWSSTLARSKDQHLLIIRAKRLANRQKRRKSLGHAATVNTPLMAAIQEHAGDFVAVDQSDPAFRLGAKTKAQPSDSLPPSIFLVELDHSELVVGVLREIKALRVGLLIVPRRQGVRISDEECAVERELFAQVPCDVLQLRPGRRFTETRDPILVAAGHQQTTTTLSLRPGSGTADDSQQTAVYIRQDDRAARPARRDRADKSGFRPWASAKAKSKTPQATPLGDVPNGLRSYAMAMGRDMLIVRAGDHLADDGQIRAYVPEKLMAEVDGYTIVVVRGALPLRSRLIRSIEHRKKSWFPQLDRPGRIEVVRRLQSTAEWNFDFLFLIFLATLLAALGLVVNSAPVVIGAMLVAPLMAPMLGIGMSVVQGNRLLADQCLSTVGRGFLLAFATGCAVGVVRAMFTSGLTNEMSARGSPNVLDLAIAFVSGIVAAYAFGRPHLLSVLPGIAIASSLVPPVATSGLSLMAFDFQVAVGAALLFLSNFVAIVLGSSFALWIVGMRGPREANPFTEWAQRWMLGFFAIAVCLAVFFSFRAGGSRSLAALIVPEAEQRVSIAAPSPDVAQPAAHAEPQPAQSRPAPAADLTRQSSGPGTTPRVVRKPVAEPPLPPPEAENESEPAEGPSVKVVIPRESREEGNNTSVQIEGLPSEDVADLLDEVLNEEPPPSSTGSATLVIIVISLVSLGYLGWRRRWRR